MPDYFVSLKYCGFCCQVNSKPLTSVGVTAVAFWYHSGMTGRSFEQDRLRLADQLVALVALRPMAASATSLSNSLLL